MSAKNNRLYRPLPLLEKYYALSSERLRERGFFNNREEYLMQCQLFLSSSSEKNVLLHGTLHEVAAVKFVLSSRIRLAALGGTFLLPSSSPMRASPHEGVRVGPQLLHLAELLKGKRKQLFFEKRLGTFRIPFTCSSHESLASSSLRMFVVSCPPPMAFLRDSTTSEHMLNMRCFWWCSLW